MIKSTCGLWEKPLPWVAAVILRDVALKWVKIVGVRVLITALAGGVGAARFLSGLVRVIPEKELSVIVNTGDDIELYGLHISPDLDIVSYTLAGLVDEEKGWGIRGDTFRCLEMLRSFGFETWFKLGDMDLATHLYRTGLLKTGLTLSEVTAEISHALGLKVRVLPMTDDRCETWVTTEAGSTHFQEYMVRRGGRDAVLDVRLVGAEAAKAAPGVIDSILENELIIVCPSNPIVSIGTILSLKGVREALRRSKARKIGVSPIVAGAPIRGYADKLMRGLGLEVSAYSVACLYKDFLDVFVVDIVDEEERMRIESLGVDVVMANTIMKTLRDRVELARVVLKEGKR
jgi:LPPG:FO 2-phospho-L-lactate transferase